MNKLSRLGCLVLVAALIFLLVMPSLSAQEVPQLEGNWWRVTSRQPDVGPYNNGTEHEVTDFTIFQAEDGTWQLVACIRYTSFPGQTRLFYRWESQSLTETDWEPKGIFWTTDMSLEYTEGRIQAPHCFRVGNKWYMFHNSGAAHCLISDDGKNFRQHYDHKGDITFYSMSRDTMVMNNSEVDGLWYAYFLQNQGAGAYVGARTAPALEGPWSDLVNVHNPGNAESPFTIRHKGLYYQWLQMSVWVSEDPMQFGGEPITKMTPGAFDGYYAPELFEHNGELYIAAYNAGGIWLNRVTWINPHAGDEPPVAELTVTPSAGTVPLTVLLDASDSSDPEGENLTYEWDLADGNGFVSGDETAVAVFESPGIYHVRVRVSDGSHSRLASRQVAANSVGGAAYSMFRLEVEEGTTGAWGRLAELAWQGADIEYPTESFERATPQVNATGSNGWQAFDGSNATVWDLESPTGIITLDLGARVSVVGVRIRAAEANRSPGTFSVYGSNDGAEWTSLGRFENLLPSDWDPLERVFPLILPNTLPLITTEQLAKATVGVAYTQPFSSSGGDGILTWSLTAGNLPEEMNLSPHGLLSGTPAFEGSHTFTVEVVDEDGETDSKTFTLVIDALPMLDIGITTVTLPVGTVGASYSALLQAANGAGILTWMLESGTLPQGITLSSGGALSGTPLAGGTSTFTIQVVDENDGVDTRVLSLTVEGEAGARPRYIEDGATMYFVGNSYMGNNGGLPNYLKRGLEQADPSVSMTFSLPGGTYYYGQGLGSMFTATVRNEIANNNHDIVVFTSGEVNMMEAFLEAIVDAGSLPVVFMTWAQFCLRLS